MKDLTPRTTVPQDPEFDAMKLSVKVREKQRVFCERERERQYVCVAGFSNVASPALLT